MRRNEVWRNVDLREIAKHGPVHFVGIAGAGMSALAELLLASGGNVTGCDIQPGTAGERLRRLGAVIDDHHDPEHVQHATAVVTTAALDAQHPELVAARAARIPVLKRAQALGSLVNRGSVLAVAGTHGKTTTTAMTTAILEEAGLHPTGFVGGRVPGWESGLRMGGVDLFVVEADEYDKSFLTLEPNIAIVTTLEADHLDIYGSLEGVREAFRQFVDLLPPDGLLVVCNDDDGARDLRPRTLPAPAVMTYGIERGADLRAVDVEVRGRGSRCRVLRHGEALGELELIVPGHHNVRNALAAIAAALHADAPFDAAQRALGRFAGVARRFEDLGRHHGIAIVDDYAHHPTEIRATIAAARASFAGMRLVAVFQPHLYSRTRDFAAAFGAALAQADSVWVTDVYPAREAPIPGVTGELIAAAARDAGAADVKYVPDVQRLEATLAEALRPGDACVLMGAGNIDQVSHGLARRLAEAS